MDCYSAGFSNSAKLVENLKNGGKFTAPLFRKFLVNRQYLTSPCVQSKRFQADCNTFGCSIGELPRADVIQDCHLDRPFLRSPPGWL